jgi:2-polyprenyl-6-methoxyphenol hydroxylase-like FAD-dependent oxidoreductase
MKTTMEDSMKNIGIIGAGIAGLQLGLLLQQHDVTATLYIEQPPEQQLNSRLPNIVIRSAPTCERERLLGVDYWNTPNLHIEQFQVYVAGPRPLMFTGDFARPVSIVDMRIYCTRLLKEFAARGGQVVVGAVQADDVERLSEEHDLVVVAVGRGSLAELFPRVPERSPYDKPQRLIVGGLFHGVANPRPLAFGVNVVRGSGEVLVLPTFSFEPELIGLAFEIVPGGVFEPLWNVRYEDNPSEFDATVLHLLREHMPYIYARIQPDHFGLTRPLDLIRGAITPTARRGYTQLANGAYVMALGDVYTLMDPIIGQGANTASHGAWTLGQAIIAHAGSRFDETFCRQVEERIWSYAGPVTEMSNARLRPPTPHMLEILTAAAQHKAIADAYVNGYNQPDELWRVLSSPEGTQAFLGRFLVTR